MNENFPFFDTKNSPYLLSPVPVTYAEGLQRMVSEIESRRARARKAGAPPLERRYILFVPDRYTLYAEKLLYANGGAFDAEVLTVNRLYYRLAERSSRTQAKPLSRLGATLTVRRILGENADKLTCLSRAASHAGFADTVYDNICQLASCGLRAADLPDVKGVAGHKLHDLRIIYDAFEQATQGAYVDAAGRLLLTEQMLMEDGGFFADTDVFFACYDSFTPLLGRIVKRICDLCGEGHALVATQDGTPDFARKRVFEHKAPSRADELKQAAVHIRSLLHDGDGQTGGAPVDAERIGVIVPTADLGRVKRIFTEYGIAYFAAEKYALSCHPLARYLTDLFAAALTGSNENYIKLSKNPYSGIRKDKADIFENYAVGTRLAEWSMAHAFEFEPEDPVLKGTREEAENVRKAVYERVRAVHKETVRGGDDFYFAVENAIPKDEAEITKALGTQFFPDVRGEIRAQTEVLRQVYGSASFADLCDALQESFACKEVGVIPNSRGLVEVGDVSAFRAGGKDHLFVLGFHEGEIPAVLHDDGLLRDCDIAAANEKNDGRAHIAPTVSARNRRAEEELLAVLAQAKTLYFSYCDESCLSPVLLSLRSLCALHANTPRALCWTATSKEDIAYRIAGIEESGNLSPAARDERLLAQQCPTASAALEWYLTGKNNRESGGDGNGFDAELSAALHMYLSSSPSSAVSARRMEKLLDGDVFAPVDRVGGAAELYRDRHVSVSRVQEYFACPLRCFLRYGLSLRPRPAGDVSPLDLGTFLHRVIELFVDGKEYDTPEATVPAIVAHIRTHEPQLCTGVTDAFAATLTAEAVTLAHVVKEQIRKGGFRCFYTETPFGRAARDPAKTVLPLGGLPVFAAGEELTAEGVIDRVDTTQDAGGAARVIDYKTGNVSFSYDDIYYGRKIQLAIYLQVLRHNGFDPAGMFYFPFSSGFGDGKADGRLLGIFDTAYACIMDEALGQPSTASEVVRATSAKASTPERPVLRQCKAGVSSFDLVAVCDYAQRVLGVGASEMLSGYCAAAPLEGKYDECTYCEMHAVCTSLGGRKRERRRAKVDAGTFARVLGRTQVGATQIEEKISRGDGE